ncbi:MAG: DUF2442 domain-containing protein [Candidatus Electrothrix sp. AR3]|nr:DUF2442 domain-containing protein [Candidatus Electrothrix sp. AR3]
MEVYPKINSVKSLFNLRLLVTFQNQTQKIYDCNPLLIHEHFKPLKDLGLFNAVRVDPGGYGVSWNDNIDLAESELWINGKVAEEIVQPDLNGEKSVP